MHNIFVGDLAEMRCMARPPSRLCKGDPRNKNNHSLPLFNRSLPAKGNSRHLLLLLADYSGLEKVN